MSKENREGKEGNIVSFLLFRYLPYWPLFLILLIIGVAAAWTYIQYSTPLYEAYATLLVKDTKKGPKETDAEEQLDIFSSSKLVENEMEVIRSVKLVSEVVNELGLYAPVFENGQFKQASAYNTTPVKIRALYPDRLVTTPDYVSLTVKPGKGVVVAGKAYPFDQWVNTPFGELRFEQNAKMMMPPANPLVFALVNPKSVAKGISGRLSINPSNKLSTVVKVTLRDEVRQRAEDILNKLVEVYSRSSLEDKNTLAQNTLTFLDNRLRAVEKELDSLEGRIQQYRAKKGVVDLGEQGRLFLQNVGDADRKVADIDTKLAVLNEVEKYVSSKNSGSGIVPSTVGVDDPSLMNLLQRLNSAEVEYEKIKKTTAEKNPMVLPIAQEIEQIRPQIMESIRNQRNSLLASKRNVSATSGVYNSMLNTIPQKERELADISRQQSIKNNVYSFLLQKREQTALSITSNVSDSRIIDNAMSSGTPVSPKIPTIYLIAVAGAMILGVGIIAAKEVLNRKILFRSEIETFTNLPVVAEIPKVKKTQRLLNSSLKTSLAAEQFRQLRAAIGLYGKHANDKRLLVTSSISGEGKSYISTNLAASIALSGKKVVLIDLDIRSPKVSSVMGVANEAGIVEFLVGEKTPFEIIKQTKYPNLYVIGAGGEADNAMELLLSGKLNELLSAIQDDFDYIVMDTSPIEPVTDAYVLSEYCDRTLVVVRHGYTPKTMVQLFDESNKIKALKNPVIVFNDVRSRGFLKKTYGYGYGYGYANIYRERSRKDVKKSLEI